MPHGIPRITPSSGDLGEDINARGDITGLATFNGVSHAFLLTAVPEPHAIALALSGLIGVGLSLRWRQRRQPAR